MAGLVVRRKAQARTWLLAVTTVLALGTFTARALGQESKADDLDVVQLRPNFYVIAGAGGNIVVQIGPVGVILVDSGTTQMSERVLATVRRLTTLPIRYIINTSMEADHVGGNETIAKAGLSILAGAIAAGAGLSDDLVTNAGGASVLAHENVVTRMSAPSGSQTLFPLALWPTKTFAAKTYAMYLNGEGIQVIHEPAAHTDGDTIVFFRRGDVIATGDIVDTTRFPVIDVANGGSLQGEIDALNHLMELSIPNLPLQWNPDRTLLVPGHGNVLDKIDLLEYRDMVTIVRDRIQDLINSGKTLEEVKAANPTVGYRRKYGSDTGTWTTDKFVEVVYRELTSK
jgi:glyoxylase-like metal-dependent hydrolase (beta-lactamase superfamily II)